MVDFFVPYNTVTTLYKGRESNTYFSNQLESETMRVRNLLHQTLANTLYDMNAGIGINYVRNFSDLKLESGIFEGLLHLTAREEPEIAPTLRRRAITLP